jgi:hypothetical protein
MQILLKPKYNTDSDLVEIGVDEAGRGALAGPVTVAACIMPADFQHPLVKDSKVLSEAQKKQEEQAKTETEDGNQTPPHKCKAKPQTAVIAEPVYEEEQQQTLAQTTQPKDEQPHRRKCKSKRHTSDY